MDEDFQPRDRHEEELIRGGKRRTRAGKLYIAFLLFCIFLFVAAVSALRGYREYLIWTR